MCLGRRERGDGERGRKGGEGEEGRESKGVDERVRDRGKKRGREKSST